MDLKKRLDHLYKTFDKSQLYPDPLQFLHKFDEPADIEAMGIIAAVFAYGSVAQILKTLQIVLDAAEGSPRTFISEFDNESAERLGSLKYRFYSNNDIIALFKALRDVYDKYGSLEKLFLENYSAAEPSIKTPLDHFSGVMLSYISDYSGGALTPGLMHMFPRPRGGSACKRMNLFLRWMVRSDELDFGIWRGVDASKLVIPVDTHIARICRKLGLTEKKNVSWAMAEEITGNLARFDPADPVKYDFAICHVGIRKLDLL